MKLNLGDCFQNGPPFQGQMLNNESQLLNVDSLLKSFSKASKAANETGEVAAKAVRVTAETIESIGKFEVKSGEDENGIIGINKECFYNLNLILFFVYSSVRFVT